ncbi:schlafen-like protein 2 isoform X1 [Macrobrachium rosenbergii]|uniref:schlafen-like protein 2 isoform X1 n=2 Tax=Macrobrachium rosenbergii TaxID=79674 RepID=UPI0034D58506
MSCHEALPGGTESTPRHYILGQHVAMEEDIGHEFKGHRSLSIYDLHNLCLNGGPGMERTKNCVSISLCAMLNSGQGGTVYLGVTDSGQVKGISLTRYQKDHVLASLNWTLEKFSPPVLDSRICVDFVLVSSAKKQTFQDTKDEKVDSTRRQQLHHVAQPNYCWCDSDAIAQRSMGKLAMLYVVEIHIRPWDAHQQNVPRNPFNSRAPMIPPLHLNEANGCYVRQSCRQPRLCLEDVRRLLVHQVQEHYTLKLSRLQAQLAALQKMTESGVPVV